MTEFWVFYVPGNSSNPDLHGPFDTIEEAKRHRVVSGDVVATRQQGVPTGNRVGPYRDGDQVMVEFCDQFDIVTDPAWLFDFEVDNPDAYARKLIDRAASFRFFFRSVPS